MAPRPRTLASLRDEVIPLLRDTCLAGYVRSHLVPGDGGCLVWDLGCNRHGSALVNFENRRMYVKTLATVMRWAEERGGIPEGLPRDDETLRRLDGHIARQRGFLQRCGNKLCFAPEHLLPLPPSPQCSRARPPPPKDRRKRRGWIVVRKKQR